MLTSQSQDVSTSWCGPDSETRAVARLYAERSDEFAQAELGNTLEEVKAKLAQIRHAGWDTTTAQITPGVTGIVSQAISQPPLLEG